MRQLETLHEIPTELKHVTSKVVEDGLFEVFENGRIFRINRSGKPECTFYNMGRKDNGYYAVNTMVKGKQKHFYVHRLIAKAFIPNPENKPQVNHKDGNKLNNEIDNLEWVTSKENVRHAYKNMLAQPFRNAEPCGVCGSPTRANDDICPPCKVELKMELSKEIAREKRIESIAHIDTSLLTDKQRQTVELRMTGKPMQEIAEQLGITRQAVDSFIQRSEKRIARKLQPKTKPTKADQREMLILENRKTRKEAKKQTLLSEIKLIDEDIEEIESRINFFTI